MPPRVMQANEAGLGVTNWYQSMPPMLRTYGTIVFITTLGFRFGFVNLYYLALVWPKVIYKLEIWRLVTQFFFIGKFNFAFVVRLMWIITYGMPLENQIYQFEPADFAFMLIIIATCLTAFTAVMPVFFNGVAFIVALVYVWSRNFPDQQVSLFGLIKIQSFYLPFAFMIVSLIMGDDIMPDICGIAAGHIYYFLWDLYPRAGGPQLLKTPRWLKNVLADTFGIGRNTNGAAAAASAPGRGVTGAAAGAAPPAPNPGFRAFGGSGRRLGTN